MTPDDGRLELDDDGRVLDAAGPVRALDLHDPDAADDLATSGVQRWVDSTARPFLQRRRRPLAVAAAVAVAAAGAGLWAATRPPYVPPPLPVSLASASSPVVDDAGRLTWSLAVQPLTSRDPAVLSGLVGPGLVDGAVTQSGATAVAAATVDCTDPALPSAAAGAYSVTGRAGEVEGALPTPPAAWPRTGLARVLADWCMSQSATTAVEVALSSVTPLPGTTLADVGLDVRNASPLPLIIATRRTASGSIAVDRSPALALAPGGTGRLTTRLDVHDCSVAPALTPLGALPNPSAEDSGAPGVALALSFRDAARTASFPVLGGERIASSLGPAVCDGTAPPEVAVSDVRAARTGSGWTAEAILRVRTTGIGIGIAEVGFAGPPAGEGSRVEVSTGLDRGWAADPTSLDGGAGLLPSAYVSPSCDEVAGMSPAPLPVRVTMPDRTVVPFRVLVDDVRVLRAAAQACGTDVDPARAQALGWR